MDADKQRGKQGPQIAYRDIKRIEKPNFLESTVSNLCLIPSVVDLNSSISNLSISNSETINQRERQMLNIVQMFFQVIKNTPLLHLKVLQPSFQFGKTTNKWI